MSIGYCSTSSALHHYISWGIIGDTAQNRTGVPHMPFYISGRHYMRATYAILYNRKALQVVNTKFELTIPIVQLKHTSRAHIDSCSFEEWSPANCEGCPIVSWDIEPHVVDFRGVTDQHWKLVNRVLQVRLYVLPTEQSWKRLQSNSELHIRGHAKHI